MRRRGCLAVVIGFAAGLAGLAAIGWVLIAPVYTDAPRATDDVRASMRAFIARGQPDGRNGWDELVAVLTTRHVMSRDEPLDYDEEPGGDAAERRFEAELVAFAADDAYFDALRTALSAPRFVRPLDDDGPAIQTPMPWLGLSRSAARALQRRAILAAGQGDWPAFMTEIGTLYALADVWRRQHESLHVAVGRSIESTAYDTVIGALSVHELSAATAAALRAQLARLPDTERGENLEFQRLEVRHVVAALYGSRGFMLPVSGVLEDDRSLGAAARARFSVATWEEFERVLDRRIDDDVAEFTDGAPTASRDDDALASDRFAPVASFVPDARISAPRHARFVTHRASVWTIVAIEQYQAQHGAPPPTLDALVPTFLNAVPIDHEHGGPLRYRVDDDGTWRLYSVGDNGTDDGGAHRWRDRWRADYDATDLDRWPVDADDIAWNRVELETAFE